MNCPGCQNPLTTPRCACGAAWLAQDALVEMVNTMRGAPTPLPWVRRMSTNARACPVCTAWLEPVALVGVALDRCPPHGVFFDADELQLVLQRAEAMPAPAPGYVPEVRSAPLSLRDNDDGNLVTGMLKLIFR